jgi:hypothetical protein
MGLSLIIRIVPYLRRRKTLICNTYWQRRNPPVVRMMMSNTYWQRRNPPVVRMMMSRAAAMWSGGGGGGARA